MNPVRPAWIEYHSQNLIECCHSRLQRGSRGWNQPSLHQNTIVISVIQNNKWKNVEQRATLHSNAFLSSTERLSDELPFDNGSCQVPNFFYDDKFIYSIVKIQISSKPTPICLGCFIQSSFNPLAQNCFMIFAMHICMQQ